MGANLYLLKLSDKELAAMNAEDLPHQEMSSIEAFFSLKLSKNLISTEMIVAAIDGELSPTLAEKVRVIAMKSQETAKLYRNFEILHDKFEWEKSAELYRRRDDPPLVALQREEDSAPRASRSRKTGIESKNKLDSNAELLQWAPSEPLREKLAELKQKESNENSLKRSWLIFISYLNDLTTPRVGGTAFASLLVGLFSASYLFQAEETLTFEPDTQSVTVTRGVDIVLFDSIAESNNITITTSRPQLLQNGNTIQSGEDILENIPWAVSALSMIDGTASLSVLEENGEYSLLDTQPAYESLFFTFNNFEVSEQDQLTLRVTVENREVGVSFQMEYSVAQ